MSGEKSQKQNKTEDEKIIIIFIVPNPTNILYFFLHKPQMMFQEQKTKNLTNPLKQAIRKFIVYQIRNASAIILSLMESIKRVFITGTNRGLGQQLVKILYNKHPELQLHISSRKTPVQLANQWQQVIPNHSLNCYQIDLNNSDSIREAVDNIRRGKIQFDFIVANAAVGCDFGQTIPSYEVAHSTLKTNVDSTISFVKHFSTLLSSTGRVIIVSAALGSLTAHSPAIRKKLADPNIIEEQILQFSRQYIEAAKQKNMGDFNWSAYRTSKALINTWSRFILPKYLKQSQTSVCMHPGWCSTDMGGKNAFLTPEEGAFLIYECFWLKEVEKDKFYNKKFCSYVDCQ